MPLHLFAYWNLRLAAATTALFMASFGALPYFQTILFQRGMGLSVLETGLAFLPPAVATAAGAPVGARIVNRYGTRAALVIGFIVGCVGMSTLASCVDQAQTYCAIFIPLIVIGLGQGIVWTGMWIAAASGVRSDEQGVASGIAASTQQIGGAIGLALLIAIAASFAGQGSEAPTILVETRAAFYAAAVSTIIASLVAMALRAEKKMQQD